MSDFDTFQSEDMAFDAMWDGFEDESDWQYAMQFDDREQDDWSERYDYADEDFGGEDAYLDSYWEGLAESFWGE